MKKKLLIGAVAALFLGAGVFTATSLTQKEQISDLTLANIEAMTRKVTVISCCPLTGGSCVIISGGKILDTITDAVQCTITSGGDDL